MAEWMENTTVIYLWCGLPIFHVVCSAYTVWFVEAEHLLEALLEVVREETIEKGVGAGIDVGENDQEKVDGGSGIVLGDDVHQVDNVGNEEGQPTNDKNQHDYHHHACHLAL